jgi:hypothetical protein
MEKQFALEEDDRDMSRYHRIHAAGCKHLRDPNPIGEASTLQELLGVAAQATSEFESLEDVRAASAPCVAHLLKGK